MSWPDTRYILSQTSRRQDLGGALPGAKEETGLKTDMRNAEGGRQRGRRAAKGKGSGCRGGSSKGWSE